MGLWSANLAKLAAPLPELIDLPATEARMIMALRLAVAAHKHGVDARDALEKRLGGRLPMIRFLMIIETIGNAWPDPFQVGRCCCPHMMPDEILLLNMIRQVVHQNKPAFDALLCEMIDDCGRQRIFSDMEMFIGAYKPTYGIPG
jgi:hypothetical protein